FAPFGRDWFVPPRREWSLATPVGRRLSGETNGGVARTGDPPPAHRFFLFSIVRRKRNDSVPVSIMCARSVTRSSRALHNRALGNTVVHSEKGRLVVTISAALSARSDTT